MTDDGKTLVCQNCLYKWVYKGDALFYASCPRCKSSVSLKKGSVASKPFFKKTTDIKKEK